MGKKIQNNLPFVSIVVPCRNEEKYIGKCLDSLIYNDYPKNLIEIFVIDGMSEDNTKGIIEKYIEKYPIKKTGNISGFVEKIIMYLELPLRKKDLIYMVLVLKKAYCH